MADIDDEEQGGDGFQEKSAGKSSVKKKLLFFLLFLLSVGGGGSGLYYSGFLDDAKKPAAETEAPAPAPPSTTRVFFDLPDMLVNLNSDESKPHFLKFRASLELQSDIDATAVKPLEPRIIDFLQVYMRELRLEDLRGNGGMLILRQELLARINETIKPVEASDLLFTNLLVQ